MVKKVCRVVCLCVCVLLCAHVSVKCENNNLKASACLYFQCIFGCVCVWGGIFLYTNESSAPELLNHSLVTLTQMPALSNHHPLAISGRLSGHISKVVIRPSTRSLRRCRLGHSPVRFFLERSSIMLKLQPQLEPLLQLQSPTCMLRWVHFTPFSHLLSLLLYLLKPAE